MEFARKKKKISAFDIAVTAITLVLVAAVLYPLILVVSSSISDPVAVASGEVLLLPKGFTLDGYKRVFQDEHIMMGYVNSLFYTIVGTLINLLVTIPAGYVMTKTEVPGTKIVMMLFLFTMYFSGGMIPSYLNVKDLHLLNSLWSLILPSAITTTNLIIMKSAFQAIPESLSESARLDGASYLQILIKIMIPLSKATMAVMVLYYGVSRWNSWFAASIYLNDSDLFPLQLVMRNILNMANQMAGSTGAGADEMAQLVELIKYALIVVTTAPILVLYPFLQKYFVKGVMIGSVKG